MRIAKPLLEPWAITAEGMQRVLAVATRGQLFREVLGPARAEWKARPRVDEPGDPVDGTGGTLRVIDGIGVISIQGTLFRHAGMISDFSGGVSDDAIVSGLEAAMNDATVRGVLLRCDSPGGEANGTSEVGRVILAARDKKPLWSYVEGMCCSKAYWYAAQTSRIISERSGMSGSIGVRQDFFDESGADEQTGIKVVELVSRGAPAKRSRPLDDEVLGRHQVRLDDLEQIFVEAVAEGRGVSVDAVYEKFGQGDYMIAAKALAAGLIDELGTFNSTMQALRDEVARRSSRSLQPGRPAGARATADKERSMNRQQLQKGASGPSAVAEDDPAAPAGAAEMVPCPHCEDGKMPDGSKCETCGGTGKVAKEPEEAAGGHQEPDGDEPEPEKAAARAQLAAMAGLPATARLSQIAAAAQAKLVPLTTVARVQADNAALAARLGKLEEKEHAAAAELAVSNAIADGRTTKEKGPHLVAEFVKAEKARAGSGGAALEPQLFPKGTFTLGVVRTAGGNPIGKADEPTDFAQEDGAKLEADYSAKADEIAKKERITFSAALAKMPTAYPELHAKLRALRAAGKR